MTRTAQCHCGQVTITCEGEPDPVLMCSCEYCQRRTGAPFMIGAWFAENNVTIQGQTKTFTRANGDQGMVVSYEFCPDCGTTIWWPAPEGSALKGKISIAGGCFADANFPAPTLSIYEKHKHPWVSAPEGTPGFEKSFNTSD